MSDEITPIDPEELPVEETPEENSADNNPDSTSSSPDKNNDVVKHQLRGMYRNWFLDYASYVILERAVPHIDDGLKPVQRRILHSMKTLDDGRFNKVANIVVTLCNITLMAMRQSTMHS